MSKISERIKYVRIEEGFCQICGSFRKLSQDHVPPKCISRPKVVEQKLITEVFSGRDIRGVKANQGSVFKTICSFCNNNLSVYDSEIKRVTERLNMKIVNFLTSPFSPYSFISENFDATLYLKGMIGHMLAAVPNIACEKDNFSAPFFEPLRKFVLGTNECIEKTHTFYYWFYPHKMNVAGSCFSVFDTTIPQDAEMGVSACLYFYPVALFVTDKGMRYSELDGLATELSLNDRKIYLNISAKKYNDTIFPFFGLKNSIVMMSNAFITVSSGVRHG